MLSNNWIDKTDWNKWGGWGNNWSEKVSWPPLITKLDIRDLNAKAVEVPPLESLSQRELKNIINRMTEFRWFLTMTQTKIEDYWKKQDPYVGTALGE